MKYLKPFLYFSTALVFLAAYTVAIDYFIEWAFPGFFDEITDYLVGVTVIAKSSFIAACILAPLWEEAIFRYFPREMARLKDRELLVPFFFVSCIIFGLLHGTPVNILVQGVAGAVFFLLYLRTNLFWAMLLHGSWNFLLMFGFEFLNKTFS